MYLGLLLFALGSFVAATAPDIYIVILGRILQGAGAISAAVIALAADLTREEHRTKSMAMIGSTIGLVFALSLVAAPWLNQLIGVPGIFAVTGVLALGAMLVIWLVVPAVSSAPAVRTTGLWSDLKNVLADPQLARLNWGIFALHAVLMALFIAVPFALRDAGLPLNQHWKVYLPVMLASFVGRARAAPAQGLVCGLGCGAARGANGDAVAHRQRMDDRPVFIDFFHAV
jgi:MFS family permease